MALRYSMILAQQRLLLGWVAHAGSCVVAKAGHHFAGIRKRNAAPSWLGDITLEHFRIRHDTVGQLGKLTLRHGSRLHHLSIGTAHAHTPVLILVTTDTVTVTSKTNYQLIASHDHNYWRNQTKTPADGREICHR